MATFDARFSSGDQCYYCNHCGHHEDTLEDIKHHVRISHDRKRVSVENVEQDPRLRRKGHKREVGEILALPDAHINSRVSNLIPVDKIYDGKPTRFTINVFQGEHHEVVNNGNGKLQATTTPALQAELLDYNLSLNSATCMKVEAFLDPPIDQNLAILYGALRHLQTEFVYFQQEIEYHIIALIAVCSYFPETFRTFPFLAFTSPERGWGKSTATKVTVFAAYNGIWVTIPSEASFFRLVEDSGGTVGIDQIDDIFAQSKQNTNLLALLDGAHQKGMVVPRCEPDDAGKQIVKFYDPFTIIVYNGCEAIPGSLLSRTIIIPMTECRGRKQLRRNPVPDDFQHIRDQLYVWRLRHHEEVKQTYHQLIEDRVLVDRNEDIFLPLLTIAKLVNEELFERLLAYAKSYDLQQRSKRLNTWILALIELLPQFIGRTEVIEIRDAVRVRLLELGETPTDEQGNPTKQIGSRWVTKHLDNLGFERATRAGGTGRTRFHITKERVDELLFIYQDSLNHKDKGTLENSSQSSQSSHQESPEREKPSETSNNGAENTSTNTSQKQGKCEESEESEAFSKVSKPYESPDFPSQQERLAQLIQFCRDLAVADRRGLIEVVYLYQRCERIGWTAHGYTHTDLDTDIGHLRDQGILSKVYAGAYQLLIPLTPPQPTKRDPPYAFGKHCEEVKPSTTEPEEEFEE